MPTFFLSYADADRPRIEKVIAELRQRGEVTNDDEFTDWNRIPETGQGARADLKHAIAEASKLVVLWGDAAEQSAHVNYEAGLASAFDKLIVFVLPRGRKTRLPTELSDRPVIHLRG